MIEIMLQSWRAEDEKQLKVGLTSKATNVY